MFIIWWCINSWSFVVTVRNIFVEHCVTVVATLRDSGRGASCDLVWGMLVWTSELAETAHMTY